MQSEFVVYVMYSKKYNRTYTGFTSNLIERFKDHNQLGNKGYCRKYRPWMVVYVKFFQTKKQALHFEKQLKSGKGREWIKKEFISLL